MRKLMQKSIRGRTQRNWYWNYIRTGVEKYTDGNWNLLAGEEKTAFVSYVAIQDEANGTSVLI